MKSKSGLVFNILGIILGIIMVVMGFVFMGSPAESYSTKQAESAKFGGDFYTYQYEATTVVAKNAAVTANNIRELGDKLATYCGTFFVFGGLLVSLHYGKCYAAEKAENGKKTEKYIISDPGFVSEEEVPEL